MSYADEPLRAKAAPGAVTYVDRGRLFETWEQARPTVITVGMEGRADANWSEDLSLEEAEALAKNLTARCQRVREYLETAANRVTA